MTAPGPVDDAPLWLGTKAAAERLGVTARTLYSFIDEGDLPSCRVRGVIRIKTDDLEAFERSCRIDPNDDGTAGVPAKV